MDIRTEMITMSRAVGLSCDEFSASEVVAERLRPYVDSVNVDDWGNVIGVVRCGVPGAPTLMFDAHIDQVGFYVTGYEDEGFLRIDEIGMDTRLMPGMSVRVRTRDGGEIPGLITSGEGVERGKAADVRKLFVDIGMNREEAERLVPLAAPIVCDCPMYEVGDDLLFGPAIDDRGCFLALMYMAEKLRGEKLNCDIVIQGSGREEVGGPSASIGALGVNPDLFFAVDVCHAKTPDNRDGEEFYKGPSIAYGGTSDKRASDRLFELAKEHNIPHQEYVIGYISGTNAGEVEIAGKGIPCAVVSLPIRYMHAPYEVVCIKDIESLGELLYRFALDFKGLEAEE